MNDKMFKDYIEDLIGYSTEASEKAKKEPDSLFYSAEKTAHTDILSWIEEFGLAFGTEDKIKEYIKCLIGVLEQLKKELKSDSRDGRNLAYYGALSLLKVYLTIDGPEKFGLDFDIDRRFL